MWLNMVIQRSLSKCHSGQTPWFQVCQTASLRLIGEYLDYVAVLVK